VSEKTTEMDQQKLPRNWWWRSHWGRNQAVGDVPVSSKAPAWWNFVEGILLRSRLHHWRSDTDMLLIFKGRKSGKKYTVPVCYIQEGDVISCITKVGWWRNLQGGVPVTVCVKGRDLQGTADTVVDDQETIARVMGQLLEAAPVGHKYYAVPAGPDGRATWEELMKAAAFTVLIRITLAG
jgi:F420H(2)-dependent quinone reductase